MTPSDIVVTVTPDIARIGQHTNGPRVSWITVTHLPTMISATAFHSRQWKSREMALACVEMMMADSDQKECLNPERMIHDPAT